MAGDAVVGEEVGRVGEDEVDGRFGDEGEEFEAITLIEAEVMLGVVEDRGRKPRQPADLVGREDIGIGEGSEKGRRARRLAQRYSCAALHEMPRWVRGGTLP